MGNLIKKHYDRKDIKELKAIAGKQLQELYGRVEELRSEHRKQWFRTYKPFGWEVIDMRYGGLLARIDTAIERLSDYVNGIIDKIEELEAEKLYFDGCGNEEEAHLIRCNIYHRIVSASPLGFNS